MATKNTQSNSDRSYLSQFISAGQSEIDHKGKGELKASLALAFALLASDDAVTLADWRIRLSDYNNGDEKLRDAARFSFAEYVGATTFLDTSGDKERKTQDYRNLVQRQYKRIQFAVDIHDLKFREFVVIHETAKNIVTHIKGGSDLASRIWVARDWGSKKVISDKRSPLMDILVSQRASLTQQGEVSWNQLADMVAGWQQRRQNVNRTTQTISAKQPFAAVKALKAIVSSDPAAAAVHFSAVESKMMALETAEDVMAFATEGDDPEMVTIRSNLDKAVEALRVYLQQRINAKASLLTRAAA